ncbi:ANR family transcriptional regulator [Pantoea sp. BAV 3049]|uniref:ANR family transcriptional regulator n=1 Tax=Pantoea sp. BAV 3049 TaxID=2654188 RepID=UPI00131B91A5|nr:ANR family transcriptional regulator [Pantoea sp. BAV 3049]
MSMNPASACKGNRYVQLASDAAQQERMGNHAFAAKLWGKAALLPGNKPNRAWAEGREDTCLYKAGLPRRAPYASH